VSANTFALALLDILGSQGASESWKAVVDQRRRDLDSAKAELDAKPDALLQKKCDDAKASLEKAQEFLNKGSLAEQAYAEAEKAAHQVTGPRDFKNFQTASERFDQALAIGRALAAQLPDPLGNIRTAVGNLPDGNTKECLLVLVEKTRREAAMVSNQVIAAEHQVARLQENIEAWFNDAMDRVSGWYKRWAQTILLVVALLSVCAANMDTFMLAKRFSRDSALRASVVAAAGQVAQIDADTRSDDARARQALLKISEDVALPLGWVPSADDPYKGDQIPASFVGWLVKLLGLLITVCAVSLGAPFWFDMLSKFVNLRGSGTRPGEAGKGGPAQPRGSSDPGR